LRRRYADPTLGRHSARRAGFTKGSIMVELGALLTAISGGISPAATSGIVLPTGTLPVAHPLVPPIRPS
jgi:hypothetical protein